MNRRGCLWFAAGLVLAIMAGVLIFMTVQRMAQAPKELEEPPRVEILVAARDIPLHTLLGPADVEPREVPPDMVPADGVGDPEEVVGKLTTVDIAEGEIMLRRRLISPDYVGPRAAVVMSPDQVLIAFPASDLLSNQGILRPGDHVDLMYTFDFGKAKAEITTGPNTLTILQDLKIAAVMYPGGKGPESQEGSTNEGGAGSPTALLLTVDEQDALLIKYFRDAGASADLALRSPMAEGEFEVVPVDGDYLVERLKIRWRVR